MCGACSSEVDGESPSIEEAIIEEEDRLLKFGLECLAKATGLPSADAAAKSIYGEEEESQRRPESHLRLLRSGSILDTSQGCYVLLRGTVEARLRSRPGPSGKVANLGGAGSLERLVATHVPGELLGTFELISPRAPFVVYNAASRVGAAGFNDEDSTVGFHDAEAILLAVPASTASFLI